MIEPENGYCAGRSDARRAARSSRPVRTIVKWSHASQRRYANDDDAAAVPTGRTRGLPQVRQMVGNGEAEGFGASADTHVMCPHALQRTMLVCGDCKAPVTCV
jgi:hypothetical protein